MRKALNQSRLKCKNLWTFFERKYDAIILHRPNKYKTMLHAYELMISTVAQTKFQHNNIFFVSQRSCISCNPKLFKQFAFQ